MSETRGIPSPSSPSVRRRMQNTPRRDTPFEIRVRRLLHAKGLRYRIDQAIPEVTRSRPDIVFRRERVAVFLDGCFWHSCPLHASTPKANREWWRAKLRANVKRDRQHDRELISAGWAVSRFWEHEEAAAIATQIEQVVLKRRDSAAAVDTPPRSRPREGSPHCTGDP